MPRDYVIGLSHAAQIVALWSLAVAQPLYDLLARTPEFLVVRGMTLRDTVVMASGLSLLAPLALVGVVVVAGLLGALPRSAVHHLIVGLLAAALLLNGISSLPLPAPVLVAGALLIGALVAWALQRWTALRSWAALLACTAVIFPIVFFWRVPPVAWGWHVEAPTREVPAPEDPVPVVFVIFDQLSLVSLLTPDGKIDAKSFPNFAALAEHSTWFPNTITVHRFTHRAIPALLTGQYPDPPQQPILGDHPDNLFTLLASHYDIVAQESLTRLCPREICEPVEERTTEGLRSLWADLRLIYLHIVLPETMSARLAPVDQAWMGFGTGGGLPEWARPDSFGRIRRDRKEVRGDRAADFLRYLDRIEGTGPRSLYFYASFLPHAPNDYLPSGRLYSANGALVGARRQGRWGNDAWAILQDQQRYLLQVGFVDRQLGLLVQRLRDAGLYDDALFVVTSDHGVSFRPGGLSRELTPAGFADTLAVPLFIKLPGQREGRRDERAAETVDVLPTILDAIGIRFPLDGRSLLAHGPHRSEHPVFEAPESSGGFARFSTRELRRAIDESVRRKAERFGTEGFSTRFFQIGELGHLVGRKVSDLKSVPATSVEAEIIPPIREAGFDPAQGFVPAHITGKDLPAAADREHGVAIAVNGVVGAVTHRWNDSLRRRRSEDWATVVDEKLFVPGANRIDLFRVRQDGGEVELVPIGTAQLDSVPPAAIATSPDREPERAPDLSPSRPDAGSRDGRRRRPAG